MMKKIFPWLILIALSALVGTALLIEIESFGKSISSLSSFTPATSADKSAGEKTITVVMVGDIMLDRGVEHMINKEGGGDFRFPFLEIANELKGANLLFGNLEGPISDKGVKVGSIYSFRAEPEAIEGLSFSGFDLLSLANNHAFDYGREALEDTLSRLKEAGINFVGAGFNENEAYSPFIMEVNGSTGASTELSRISSPQVKIAFLAYTNLGSPNWQAVGESSGIAWLSEEKLKEGVKSAREEADIVIVSFHFGEEYQTEPNEEQKYFSRLAVDCGADFVLGHHPHVVQTNEIYREKHIFYSLGNFIFDQGFSEETMKGQIVEILIKNKKIEEIRPLEIKINRFFQPEIAEEMILTNIK